jgi:hypothetical protein
MRARARNRRHAEKPRKAADARLDQLMALEPSHQAGVKLQSMIPRMRASLAPLRSVPKDHQRDGGCLSSVGPEKCSQPKINVELENA